MKVSIEMRALVWAALAAALSLGGATLLANSIRLFSTSSTSALSDSSFGITVSPELVDQGRQFFAMSCSQCHGDDAHGDEGPDLHHLAISNSRIATTIKKGIKGEMPTFAKKYDDHQVAALVSYLRTLR
jgi:mono/diheme cytochrome c family protein